MNPKVIVDHELFITCRLCLDKKGIYQIGPDIQENVQFAYSFELELNNGLPQLICVNCDSTLTNFVCTKQFYQEKQKKLKNWLQYGIEKPVITSNAAIEHQQECKELSSHSDRESSEAEQETATYDIVPSCSKNSNKSKKTHKSWRSVFVRSFGCRFCSKKCRKKDEIENHLRTHTKNILDTCFVRVPRHGEEPNITGSTKCVVLNQNKILKYKKSYNIVYTPKANYSSDYSDKVNISKIRIKRRRIESDCSVETLLLEENNVDETDIELLDPLPKVTEQMKSSSCKSKVHSPQINKDDMDTLISACYNKLLEKMDITNVASKNAADKSQLQHKLLSIGSKIINTNPINCIGILRYLEYKNLEVNFIMNESNDNQYVRIHTKLRSKKEKNTYNNTNNWKSLQNTSISRPTSDFFDVLNKAINTETVKKKPINPEHTHPKLLGILLNDNPVANPMRVPKKNREFKSDIQKPLESECTRGSENINSKRQNVSNTTSGLKDTLTTISDGIKQNNAYPVANPKIVPKKNEELKLDVQKSLESESTRSSDNINSKQQNVSSITSGLNNTLTPISDGITQNNAYPVANPKIVPKKNEQSMLDVQKPPESESTRGSDNFNSKQQNVSSITSGLENTLTPISDGIKQKDTYPKIKVKPASELIEYRHQSPGNNRTFAHCTYPAVHPGIYSGTNNMFSTNYNPINKANNPPQYINMPASQPLSQIGNTMINDTAPAHIIRKPECITLHTVEFPNTETSSPFEYFKKVLHVHNLNLVDSKTILSSDYQCLIKFNLNFQQQDIHVGLCLALYSNTGSFCIKVANYDGKDLDFNDMSADWQWKLLKFFTNQIVPRLFFNAQNISALMLDSVQKFVFYLKSIEKV